jgi:sec-independent protein translocase protein TatA
LEGWAIGPTEIIIVLVIVLLLFGARRIPEIARSLGSGAREFKEGIQGKDAPDEGIDPPSTPSSTGPKDSDHST